MTGEHYPWCFQKAMYLLDSPITLCTKAINPATLGNIRLALPVQIGFTEHRQNHQDRMLGSQPSSNMTHRSEELGNTANVDEKYARDTYMQFVCQFLTALNIF